MFDYDVNINISGCRSDLAVEGDGVPFGVVAGGPAEDLAA
jgi:hypothetical protein